MLTLLLFHAMLLHCTLGDNCIYHLNESEYAKMPQLYHLDPYEPCVHEEGGVYCTVKFDIVTDEPSALYTMMQEYSAHTLTHFNHTRPIYGICLTKTCKKFIQEDETADPSVILERCLNESLWRDYRLKSKVSDGVSCEKHVQNIEYDALDIAVGVAVVVLLVINLIGSLYGFFGSGGNRFLNCFSVSRNWYEVTSPGVVGPETRFTKLKAVHGLRAITMAKFIAFHTLLQYAVAVYNPRGFEESYQNGFMIYMMSGTPIVHICFVLSGFFFAYMLQLQEEKETVTLSDIPRMIRNRWLRLTVVYAFIMALQTSWLRYAGAGPMWKTVMGTQIDSCREDWWANLLYINNYLKYTRCMPTTWFLAVDMQLYIVGLIALVVVRKRRKLVLSLLFVAGVLLPAAYTYYQDLDTILIGSPESFREFFTTSTTYNNTYKWGHTNCVCYVIGLALGLAIYHWQKTDYQFNKYVKHRYLQWLTVPAMVVLVMMGRMFYEDGPRVPLSTRVLHAAFAKPVMGGLTAFLLIGIIFKFEDVYRGVLEWEMWVMPSRLSYCGCVVHMTIINMLLGTRPTLVNFSFWHVSEIFVSCVMITALVSLPLHLFIEAPFQNLVKVYLTPKSKHNAQNGTHKNK